nr:hypothetical protein [Tanacetum cinerariifolium]
IARQLEVELQAEVERERQREEQASMDYIANLYDEVQEHELITDFVPVGSEEDERMIRDMNKKDEEESSDKGVDNIKKRKEGSRMKRCLKGKRLIQPAEEELGAKQVQVDAAVVEDVVEDVAEDVAHVATLSPPPHGIPSPPQEPSSPPQQPHVTPPAPTQGEAFPATFQQVLDTCSALLRCVEHLEHDNVAQRLEIIKLKARVKKLEQTNKVKSLKLRRLKKVGASRQVESSDDMEDVFNQGRVMNEDEGIELDKGKGILVKAPKPMKKKDQIKMDAEYARKLQEKIDRDHDGFNKDIDWDVAMDHVNKKSSSNPQYIKRYQGMKKRPQTESEARKNMMIYLKNTTGYKMNFFKGMTYAQICPIFQARFDENIRFLFKSREEMEAEDQEIIKSINETPAQKAAKRRKLSEEAQEAKDLRKRLEVVEDEDDDVFVEATPLAQKNFDREDLETLCRIVKDRFSTLLTLKTMFEEPDGQDAIWRNQKSVHGLALVKRWKLLTSCGVHVITLSTVQLFLLVERRYPLSRFTLEQLVNVARLQVEKESEMSLELLRFTRQQL